MRSVITQIIFTIAIGSLHLLAYYVYYRYKDQRIIYLKDRYRIGPSLDHMEVLTLMAAMYIGMIIFGVCQIVMELIR